MDRPAEPWCCSSPTSCIFNDLFINCEGRCSQRRFHAICVGISTAEVPLISASPNFFWFCDVCRDHLRTGRTTVAVLDGSAAGEKTCGASKCIFTDRLIRCDGPCRKDFHGMCVKLTENDLTAIGSSVNIFWFCDACKTDVLPVLDGSREESAVEAEHRFVDEGEKSPSPSEESENGLEPTAVESSPVKDVEQDPMTEEDDSPMKDLQKVSTSENMQDTSDLPAVASPNNCNGCFGVNQRSPDSSSNLVTNSDGTNPAMKEQLPEPDVGTPTDKVFTFGAQNQPEPSTPNFLKPQEIAQKFREIKENLAEQNKRLTTLKLKLETDENNNEPAPKKLLLGTGSIVSSVEPATVKQGNNSRFSLFVRFSVPNMSECSAELAVRNALGMSRRDSATAWSVTPHHLLNPRFSTFRVDLDARWKLAALCSSSWRATENLLEHREWFQHKI